jgi:hypothetical protein
MAGVVPSRGLVWISQETAVGMAVLAMGGNSIFMPPCLLYRENH